MKEKMKTFHKWVALLLVPLIWACSGATNVHKMRIQIPRRAEVRIADYDSIVFTDFLIKEAPEAFDLNAEVIDYFSNEIGVEMEERVNIQSIDIEDETIFETPEFWISLPLDDQAAVIFSGTANMSQEIRKALVSKGRRQFEDPFPAQQQLATQKFFILEMNIHIIDSESGEILFQQEFKESNSYTNPNQMAYDAFFDLAFEIKEKLFQAILGGEKLQERYLILR